MDDKKWGNGDYIWFVYFFIMFNLYTLTYVQLIGQLMVVGYTFLDVLKNARHIKKNNFMIVVKYLLWLGVFFGWCLLSNFWAVYPPKQAPSTILTMFRIFVIGFCLIHYMINSKKVENVIKIIIYNGLICFFITLFINPIGNWGSINFKSLLQGYHRNDLSSFAVVLICLSFYMRNYFGKLKCIFLITTFLLMIILCGSRKALILIFFALIIYLILIDRFDKKVNYLLMVFCIFFSFFLIADNVTFIRETYVNRINQMLLGDKSKDLSTVGRNKYIEIGFDMYKDHPINGWGTDGFYNYLLRHPYAGHSAYFLNPVYSHNNYIELLVCYGVVGLFLFYDMHIVIIKNYLFNHKKSVSKLLLVLSLLFLVSDYGGVVFSIHINMYFLILVFCMNQLNVEGRLKL